MTRKEIVYDIINILARFNYTDDNRNDPDWLGYKVDQVREQKIKLEFQQTGVINSAWISDLGLVEFTKVEFHDTPSLAICKCPMSKAIIPAVVNLPSPNSPFNYGLRYVLSACGTTQYFPEKLDVIKDIPAEHVKSNFHYYDLVGPEQLFINKYEKYLLIRPILQSPLEGFVMETTFIASGSLIVGTSYTVVSGQVTHNSVAYGIGQSFTAANTTFTGAGKVRNTTSKRQMTEDDPYPVTGDMAREIVMDILANEFQIERSRVTDTRNDGQDDQQEVDKA